MHRRQFLRATGAAGLGLAFGLPFAREAGAAASLRLVTPEADPSQIKVWNELFADYAKRDRNIEIKGEFAKWDDIARKVSADLIAGQPGEILAGSSKPGFIADAAKRKLVMDLAPVVDALGRDDFSGPNLQAWQYNGVQMSIPYGQQWPVLWCRADLFEEAGVKIPVTWDDYLAAAEKLTDPAKGIYGACFPAGRTWNSHIQSSIHIWSAGGYIFDDKLNVVLDSPETRRAMKYYAEMCRFSPPDIGQYGFREASAAYTSGKTATTFYWGRVLSHLYQQAPDLLKKSRTAHYPRDKFHRTALHHDEFTVFRTPNAKAAMEVVRFMLEAEQMFALMQPVIGHLVPSRNSVIPMLQRHEWIKDNPDIVATLITPNDYAVSATNESPSHPFNYKYDAVESKNILPDMVQRIVIGKEPVELAVEKAHKEAVAATKDIKA